MNERPVTTEFNYREFKALASYIDRIGAEQKNFRRFMIVEYKARGYYHEKCLIKLDGEGNITVTDKAYAPTKEEAEAIKGEMIANADKLPKSIMATDEIVKDLYHKDLAGRKANLFVFYSRDKSEREGNVIMVQQRIQVDGGEKYFINWSYWSDGKWRKMEPDSALPFWKPKITEDERRNDRGNKRIMIHEGGKTAKMWTDMIRDPANADKLAAHPFGSILKQYEHWGMIGGALVPHRSDYDELTREKPSEVMYVCDNDPPGRRALQLVSRCYQKALMGVMFDARFPLAWDLGDDIPPGLFNESGKYVGPAWEELVTFATFATKLVPNPDGGAGRPVTILNEPFANEWFHCVQPEVFVHKNWPSMILAPNEFNNHVAPFSHVDDTARLVRKEKASKSAVLSYQPGKPSGLYADINGTFINTHIGSHIVAKAGDIGPWIDFMEHLIPNKEDRHEAYKWIATLIARPEIKMLYGMLLISEAQGIGKGTLGERIMAPLVGESNVSYPSESEIVDSNYNYWAAHKRLAVVHEIYAGHSAKAYNKLKSIVTDKTITVQKKYQANYIVDNWVHILACSNSTRAIQLSMDDRRWFVPKLTEEKRDSAYWHRLNAWLVNGGLEAIKAWCEEFVKEHGHVMRGDSSPWSIAKKEIVEDGWSPGMECAAAFLDLLRERLTADDTAAIAFRKLLEDAGMYKDGAAFLIDKDLQVIIRNRLYEGRPNDRIEKPGTLRKVAKARGWYIGEDKVWHFRWGLDRKGGRMICLRPTEASARTGDIALKPIDLSRVDTL